MQTKQYVDEYLERGLQMTAIKIKEYLDMDSEECVHNGYIILKQHSKYYVRLCRIPSYGTVGV